MPKVYIICGKICSGKSTYANRLRIEKQAVILSVDEITLTLLGQNAGDVLDDYVVKLKKYFFGKSLDIIETGVNVILDWGFWTKKERDFAKEYYASHNVEFEFHYIDINDEEWHRRIQKRNTEVINKLAEAYYIDERMAEKLGKIFEKPNKEELLCIKMI